MNAAEIIEQIKELPASEQVRIARFIAENGPLDSQKSVSIGTEADGLPVIRGRGGVITSQLVQELDCLAP